MPRDPLTGEYFRPHHGNQRFASRKNQITYNNHKRKKNLKAMGWVDQVLKQNRKILQNILGGRHKVQVSADFLNGAGFDYRFITHRVQHNGVWHYYIYDFQLTNVDGQVYTISKVDSDHLKDL